MLTQLFSIPIAKGKIVPTEEQESASFALLNDAFDKAHRGVWALESGLSTGELKNGMELYQAVEFEWLSFQLAEKAKELWNTLKYRQDYHLYIDSMWANKHTHGDTTGEHNHNAGRNKSTLSGVYYLRKNKATGHLRFRDPLETIWGMCPLDYEFPEHKKQWTWEAETHDYCIFPSWLNHSTQPYISNDERIAISINFSGFPWDATEGDYDGIAGG